MKLHLNNIGKRYNYNWIFKNINVALQSPSIVAIKGANGSGKTTLMSILPGYQAPSEGEIIWMNDDGNKIDADKIFQQVTWCSPATELPEEFTLAEIIQFQNKFKPWINGINSTQILAITNLQAQANQPISALSTGMKQRLKIALAVLADVPLVLLDEPTSNLDDWGINWYQSLIQKYANHRIIIIASNMQHDFVNCTDEIELSTNS
jgi:ABC-type multidrug transport system ATPase subunit